MGDELCGEKVPHGLTVKQAVVQAWLKQVIKGSTRHISINSANASGEETGRKLDGDMQRAIFELIDNHRDDPPKPVEGATTRRDLQPIGAADVVKECEDGTDEQADSVKISD